MNRLAILALALAGCCHECPRRPDPKPPPPDEWPSDPVPPQPVLMGVDAMTQAEYDALKVGTWETAIPMHSRDRVEEANGERVYVLYVRVGTSHVAQVMKVWIENGRIARKRHA